MKKYFALLFVVVFVIGCNVNELEFDNIQKPNLTGSFAAPIGHLTYSFRDLLLDGSDSTLDFSVDSSGLVTLVFLDTTLFDNGSDIISIGDISQSTIIDPEQTEPNSTTDPIVVSGTKTIFFEYPTSDNDPVDSLFYSSGSLIVDVSSTIVGQFDYTLTIGNTINLATGLPVSINNAPQTTIDLTNHKMVLEDTTLNGFKVNLAYDVTLDPGEEIRAGDQITININYLNQEFELLYGLFGQDTLDIGENLIDIEFFEELGDKGFVFKEPTITMNFENSFGLPMGFLFSNFYSVKNQDTTYLRGQITNNAQLIAAPSINEVGSSLTTVIDINGTNSTLPSLLETSPPQIGLKLKAKLNPQDATVENFVKSDSRVTAFSTIEVPMILQLNELTRPQDFDIGNGLDFNEADSISIRVVSVNEIPFNVLMDLEFYDEDENLLYENRFNRVIETPFLNTDGSLKQPRKNIADIAISEEGVLAMKNAAKMRFILSFSTPETQTSEDIFVKFLADAKIDIALSAVVTLSPEF